MSSYFRLFSLLPLLPPRPRFSSTEPSPTLMLLEHTPPQPSLLEHTPPQPSLLPQLLFQLPWATAWDSQRPPPMPSHPQDRSRRLQLSSPLLSPLSNGDTRLLIKYHQHQNNNNWHHGTVKLVWRTLDIDRYQRQIHASCLDPQTQPSPSGILCGGSLKIK